MSLALGQTVPVSMPVPGKLASSACGLILTDMDKTSPYFAENYNITIKKHNQIRVYIYGMMRE